MVLRNGREMGMGTVCNKFNLGMEVRETSRLLG